MYLESYHPIFRLFHYKHQFYLFLLSYLILRCRGRCNNICDEGAQLVSSANHHSDSISQRCQQLQTKLDHLAALASRRKAKLVDNSAYLQFMWKADVVESWIADKASNFVQVVFDLTDFI